MTGIMSFVHFNLKRAHSIVLIVIRFVPFSVYFSISDIIRNEIIVFGLGHGADSSMGQTYSLYIARSKGCLFERFIVFWGCG